MSYLILFLLLLNCFDYSLSNSNEYCDKENCHKFNNCIQFDKFKFTSENRSIFIIESKGRLGNHLISYTLIQTLAKELDIQPFIVEETYDYISKYFTKVNVPVFQWSFCNWEEIQFDIYEERVTDLADDENLHHGKILDLWPRGYMIKEKGCCPGEELQEYMQDHFLAELKPSLVFHQRFQDHANKIKSEIAKNFDVPFKEINFVGIHNRRTDYLNYMTHMFGVTKSPFTKKYFRRSMEYFRDDSEDEGNVAVFLYISDDMEWGKKNIKNKHKDVFFVGEGNPDDEDSIGKDLALLASCNNTITTWGSFSMWAALLCGGEYYTDYGVIVPRDIQGVKGKKKKKF